MAVKQIHYNSSTTLHDQTVTGTVAVRESVVTLDTTGWREVQPGDEANTVFGVVSDGPDAKGKYVVTTDGHARVDNVVAGTTYYVDFNTARLTTVAGEVVAGIAKLPDAREGAGVVLEFDRKAKQVFIEDSSNGGVAFPTGYTANTLYMTSLLKTITLEKETDVKIDINLNLSTTVNFVSQYTASQSLPVRFAILIDGVNVKNSGARDRVTDNDPSAANHGSEFAFDWNTFYTIPAGTHDVEVAIYGTRDVIAGSCNMGGGNMLLSYME